MKNLGILLLGLLFALPAISRDQYLELRANARAYEEPDRRSDVVAELKYKARGTPILLKLVSERPEMGYFHVAIPDSAGETGWVYKSYVRAAAEEPASTDGHRARGLGEPLSGGGGKFQVGCDLPFPIKTERREIDNACGIEGSGRGGKNLTAGNQLQNRAKNNLCVQGSAIDLDFQDFRRLQKAVDDDLGIEYGHNKLPDDRSVLKKVVKVDGKEVGEGSLVRYVGYVNHPRNSNVSKGESVNCNKSGAANNDIHIDILKDPDENICASITVEIIPHYRPKLYSVNNIKEIQGRPFRFTGHLFFDGSHKPCKTLTGPGENPKRAAVWEIHPVCAIDVCKHPDLKKCKAKDEAAWIPMQDSINEINEEDN